jgi:hypothetical protein
MFIYNEKLPEKIYIVQVLCVEFHDAYTYLNAHATTADSRKEAQEKLDKLLQENAVFHHSITLIEPSMPFKKIKRAGALALKNRLRRLRAENYKAEQELQERINSLLALEAPQE